MNCVSIPNVYLARVPQALQADQTVAPNMFAGEEMCTYVQILKEKVKVKGAAQFDASKK